METAVAEIRAQTGRQIILSDADLAVLPVSGTFSTAPGLGRRFVEVLRGHYPVSVETQEDGSIWIGWREEACGPMAVRGRASRLQRREPAVVSSLCWYSYFQRLTLDQGKPLAPHAPPQAAPARA